MDIDKMLMGKLNFLGYSAAQDPLALLIFLDFFNTESFDVVIEIGTGRGAFSLFLAFCCFVRNMEFHTVDLKVRGSDEVYDKIKYIGGKFYNIDVYSDDGVNLIKDLVSGSDGRVLVLVDGAIKKKFINNFSKYLKKDDVIMGHDYFRNRKEFNKQSKWSSCEVVNNDIKKTCANYNLEEFHEDQFNKIFWTCRIKTK